MVSWFGTSPVKRGRFYFKNNCSFIWWIKYCTLYLLYQINLKTSIMQKITTIDKATCRLIREALNPVIAKFMLETFGLEASIGNASFTDKDVTFKLTAKAEGLSSLALASAEAFGWPEIGTKLLVNGKTFEVCDYDLKRTKRPIIAKVVGDTLGSRYTFDLETIKRTLIKA